MVEAVLAGLEGAVAGEPEESEGVAAADDAFFSQEGGDARCPGAGGMSTKVSDEGPKGCVDDVRSCAGGEEEKEEQGQEELQRCASGLEEV